MRVYLLFWKISNLIWQIIIVLNGKLIFPSGTELSPMGQELLQNTHCYNDENIFNIFSLSPSDIFLSCVGIESKCYYYFSVSAASRWATSRPRSAARPSSGRSRKRSRGPTGPQARHLRTFNGSFTASLSLFLSSQYSW